MDGPELIIVTQAIDRLRRSTGGAVTNEKAQDNLKQQPVCPKCGNEMFLHYKEICSVSSKPQMTHPLVNRSA